MTYQDYFQVAALANIDSVASGAFRGNRAADSTTVGGAVAEMGSFTASGCAVYSAHVTLRLH